MNIPLEENKKSLDSFDPRLQKVIVHLNTLTERKPYYLMNGEPQFPINGIKVQDIEISDTKILEFGYVEAALFVCKSINQKFGSVACMARASSGVQGWEKKITVNLLPLGGSTFNAMREAAPISTEVIELSTRPLHMKKIRRFLKNNGIVGLVSGTTNKPYYMFQYSDETTASKPFALLRFPTEDEAETAARNIHVGMEEVNFKLHHRNIFCIFDPVSFALFNDNDLVSLSDGKSYNLVLKTKKSNTEQAHQTIDVPIEPILGSETQTVLEENSPVMSQVPPVSSLSQEKNKSAPANESSENPSDIYHNAFKGTPVEIASGMISKILLEMCKERGLQIFHVTTDGVLGEMYYKFQPIIPEIIKFEFISRLRAYGIE